MATGKRTNSADLNGTGISGAVSRHLPYPGRQITIYSNVALGRFWCFAVILCLAGLGLSHTAVAANTVNAEKGAPVGVAKAKQQLIYQQVQVTGSVTSPQVASLSSATSGLVASVLVEEGALVEKGKMILELDDELNRWQTNSADAQLKQARVALDDARRRLKEAKRLGPQRGIAETEIRALEAEVAQDQADFERAEADFSYQQALLARHQLKAPFSGVISRKMVDSGEWVSTGQGLFELVATEPLRLDFSVAEDYIAELSEDAQVSFQVHALPGERFPARVQARVPVMDRGTRTFLVRVVPEKQDSRLMPGMSATAIVQIATGREGVVVPRDATLRQSNGRVVVWTVEESTEGFVAREHPVTLGQSFSGQVEILRGIPGDAVVVIRGNESLQNGQAVYIASQLK